jgi:hypothetical protein
LKKLVPPLLYFYSTLDHSAWQVEIQGDWINVRDELAAFIVHKKNGWGIQKEQVHPRNRG